MAEVTREMVLEYMQARGGVVKNVDLVRHFRKYLQLSDQRAKDIARDQFKARVNEVAYIKADNKGEKYLYLKTDLDQSSTPSTRDSTYSKRDSTHSILSKRDSAYSILSGTSYISSGESHGQSPAHQTSVARSTPPREPPGHGSRSTSQANSTSSVPYSGYARTLPSQLPGQVSSSSRLSGQTSSNSRLSGQPSPSRQSGQTSSASRQSGQPSPSRQSGQSSSASRQSGQTSSASRQSGQTSSASRLSGQTVSRDPPPASSGAGLSLLGDSLLGDSALSSFLSGGTSTSTSSADTGGGGGGGDSSFASDIFGTIGSFWGDTQLSSALSSDSKPSPSTATITTTSQNTATTSRGRSQVAESASADVNLKSYKRIPSPPLTTTSTTTTTTRPPFPPPSQPAPLPPSAAPSKKNSVPLRRHPPSPPPPSKPSSSPPRRRPPSPPPPDKTPPSPPRRNLSYTTTYNGTAPPHSTSGSVFSPPPPQTSPSGGDLLAQMTSELGSLGGGLGSLLDSFGDFSKPVSTRSTTTTSAAASQPSKMSGVSESSSDRSSKFTSSSSSSDRSSVTLVAGDASKVPYSTPSSSTTATMASNTSGPSATRLSGSASTFSTIRSTPPPAPGSPMRVPRRNIGPPMDPPPQPPSSSQSTLTRRQGSYDGGPGGGGTRLQDGSPRISIKRADSPRSDSSNGGVVSPPVPPQPGDTRNRSGSSYGLPPLPPSADPRRSLAGLSNGGMGVVALRPHDRAAQDRIHSSVRRSRNLDRTSNLESLTRASIMTPHTPPSMRRSMQAPGPGVGGAMFARPAPSSSGEDLSQGDQDSSLSAPSEEYELDPLEKEWMLACASGDSEKVLSIIITDGTLINRRDFLHGYTALHWAAKLGRCDIMSALVLNGAFPNIKSNGGFTPLHLACQGGYNNAIAMLIRDHGANVNARDNSGRKPLDMLNYSCSENIRALLTSRLTRGRQSTVPTSPDYLPSFSQPRKRLGSLSNMWASMPNSLESTDDKNKKRASPKASKRTFSFRNKLKINSPHDKKERPKSHIPEIYDA